MARPSGDLLKQPGYTAVVNASGGTAIVSPTSGNLSFTITVSGTGTTRSVLIQTNVAAFYRAAIWLVDAAAVPGTPTLNPPDGDDTVEWTEITDVTGALTMTVEHSGTGTWYMCVVICGRVGVSDALTYT